MTVIASFCIENSPFMISDVLISVKLNHRNRIFKNLPQPINKFNESLPQTAKYTIIDVRQKTVRITDKFFLSYSGIVSQAAFAIKHFRKLVESITPTGKLFEAEISKLAKEGKVKDVCLLALIEHSGQIYCGGFNFHRHRSRKFRAMKACGSGAEDLFKIFDSYRGKLSNRECNNLEEGLGLSLALSSTLIGKELVTGDPLEKAFGGFYEITYWQNQQFRKLSDVLHVHWVFEYRPANGFAFDLPVKVHKLEYHDSILYLRDIDFDKGKTSDTVYIVKEPGLGSTAKPSEIKPELTYKWKVDHLYILLQSGKIRYKNRVQYVHENNYSLNLIEENKRLELEFRNDYFDFLQDIYAELESEFA